MSRLERVRTLALLGVVWTAGIFVLSFLPMTLVVSLWYVVIPLLGVVPCGLARILSIGRQVQFGLTGRGRLSLVMFAAAIALIGVASTGYVKSYRVRVDNGVPLLVYRGEIVRAIGWGEYRHYSNGLVRMLSGIACFVYVSISFAERVDDASSG